MIATLVEVTAGIPSPPPSHEFDKGRAMAFLVWRVAASSSSFPLLAAECPDWRRLCNSVVILIVAATKINRNLQTFLTI